MRHSDLTRNAGGKKHSGEIEGLEDRGEKRKERKCSVYQNAIQKSVTL